MGNARVIFLNFQNRGWCEKDLKDNKRSGEHLAWKYVRTFVLGHYICSSKLSVFRKLKVTFWEINCSILGTGDVRGQMSEHISSQNGGCCLYISLCSITNSKVPCIIWIFLGWRPISWRSRVLYRELQIWKFVQSLVCIRQSVGDGLFLCVKRKKEVTLVCKGTLEILGKAWREQRNVLVLLIGDLVQAKLVYLYTVTVICGAIGEFEFIDVSFSCVHSVVDHEVRHTILKAAVDPGGESRVNYPLVDPQGVLTMLWRDSLSTTDKLSNCLFSRVEAPHKL